MDDSEASEPGADPGVSGGQRRGAVCRAAARGSVRLGGADAGAAPVRQPGQAGQGTGAAVPGADDGLEPGAGDAADRGAIAQTGRVKAAAYQRTKFATRYTTADVELLAYVDKAHGNLSGPATRRILEREYTEYGQAAYQRLAAISVAQLYRLRNSAAYRKRNTSYQPTRPTPIPIGERRKPQPHGTPGYLRIDTVHQGDQDGRKGLYHINAVDQVTQWEIVAATPQISELWLMPVLEAMLEQFPFVIRGFHSDNGSEFINYTVARLLEQTADRTDQVAGASFRRQRLGGVQERRRHSQAHRLRPHRRATRRGGGRISSPASESVRQLPSSLRGAQDPHRSQRQAPPCLSALGHAVRDLHRDTAMRELPASGVSLAELRRQAREKSDTEAAIEMQRAKKKLLSTIARRSA